MWYIVSLVMLVGMVAPAAMAAAPPLRVMSFNLRNDDPRDGENGWPVRFGRIEQTLHFYRPDVLGCQEAFDRQVRKLADALPNYKWVGVGRDDGKTKGEYSPIFYNAARLEAVDSGTFWLSPTPEKIGSVGWDAVLPRISTWARFRDKLDGGREFLVFNAHLDHVGETARSESAKLIIAQAAKIAKGLPLIVTGDFNSGPETGAYKTMAEHLKDSRAIAKTVLGPAGTFGTFASTGKPSPRIDYIFVSEGIKVSRFGTLTQEWDGKHASDHFPILADVELSDPS